MNTESVTYQFPKAHATVQFTNELSAATGKKMPKLYVQCSDSYGYQREWTLGFRHEPGDSSKLYWESHIYHHPFRREICTLTGKCAEKVIERFLHLCKEYPELLFNAESMQDTRFMPRSMGFVRFAEELHRGMIPSVTML